MKKSHKVLLVLLGVIVLTVVVFKAMQPKEPEYEGRKLSEWIADLGEDPPKALEAEGIIKKVPELVLPFVEQRIFQNPQPIALSPLERFLGKIDARIVGKRRSKAYQWTVDFAALRVLGTNSFPVLERLMVNFESSSKACEVLATLDAVEILEKGAQQGQKPWPRYSSISALGKVANRKDDANKVLLQLTHDSDTAIVLHSVSSLQELDTYPDVMVPRLVELIGQGDEDLQLHLIQNLNRYGTNASAAIPLLKRIESTSKTNTSLNTLAREVLGQIAPNSAQSQ